jgi:hypothetical protein
MLRARPPHSHIDMLRANSPVCRDDLGLGRRVFLCARNRPTAGNLHTAIDNAMIWIHIMHARPENSSCRPLSTVYS